MRRLVPGAFGASLAVRFCLAHRVLCAAAIFRRAAADIVRRPDGDVVGAALSFKEDKEEKPGRELPVRPVENQLSNSRAEKLVGRFAIRI
jgi:hypothetical protein